MVLIIAAIIFAILLFIWRNKNVIKSASWRLCVLMCFGCVLGYIAVILFSVDEHSVYRYETKKWKTICNLRGFFSLSGLILTFGALFAKTYRVSKIFNMKILTTKVIPDSFLFVGIFVIYGIEAILYGIFIILGGYERKYYAGDETFRKNSNDLLTQHRKEWGSCEFVNSSSGAPIWFVIAVIVVLMFMYGLYLATTVLHVRLRKFNEALEIVISIVISAGLMTIAAPLIIFIDVESQAANNLRYATQSLTIIISFTVSLFSIILTRLIIIFKGKEKKFEKQDLKNLNDIHSDLKKQLRQDLKKLETKLFEQGTERNENVNNLFDSTNNTLCDASRIVSATNKYRKTGKVSEFNLDRIVSNIDINDNNSNNNSNNTTPVGETKPQSPTKSHSPTKSVKSTDKLVKTGHSSTSGASIVDVLRVGLNRQSSHALSESVKLPSLSDHNNDDNNIY